MGVGRGVAQLARNTMWRPRKTRAASCDTVGAIAGLELRCDVQLLDRFAKARDVDHEKRGLGNLKWPHRRLRGRKPWTAASVWPPAHRLRIMCCKVGCDTCDAVDARASGGSLHKSGGQVGGTLECVAHDLLLGGPRHWSSWRDLFLRPARPKTARETGVARAPRAQMDAPFSPFAVTHDGGPAWGFSRPSSECSRPERRSSGVLVGGGSGPRWCVAEPPKGQLPWTAAAGPDLSAMDGLCGAGTEETCRRVASAIR